MAEFNTKVGKNINKYRLEKRLTLKELGEKVGLSESSIQKYESGKIKGLNTEVLERIANALGIPQDFLTEWNIPQGNSEIAQKARNDVMLTKEYNQLTLANQKIVLGLIKLLLEQQSTEE